MKIKQIRNQLGNDLFGTLECENCGATREFVGYDDTNYYKNVLPNFKCHKCGLSSKDLSKNNKEQQNDD